MASLALGLSVVATRMEARDAATTDAQAATTLLHVMKDAKDSGTVALSSLAEGLSALAARMEAEDARQIAAALLPVIADTKDHDALSSLAQTLSALLSAVPPAEIPSRTATAVSAVGLPAGTDHALAALGLVIPAAEPLPCRLSTQALVDLLKMPTCCSEVRRVILDQLGNRYGRRFDTHWDFVRYAQDQGLHLDFTTPPQRPDRKLPPLFEE